MNKLFKLKSEYLIDHNIYNFESLAFGFKFYILKNLKDLQIIKNVQL